MRWTTEKPAPQRTKPLSKLNSNPQGTSSATAVGIPKIALRPQDGLHLRAEDLLRPSTVGSAVKLRSTMPAAKWKRKTLPPQGPFEFRAQRVQIPLQIGSKAVSN